MKATALSKYKKNHKIVSKCILKTKNNLKTMSTNSQKRKFKLVTLSSLEGESETTEIIEVKNKTEWTKSMFCQNDKSEKIMTPTKSNKQGTSKNTFQCIEEDLGKFQEEGFCDVNFDRFFEDVETFEDTCILNPDLPSYTYLVGFPTFSERFGIPAAFFAYVFLTKFTRICCSFSLKSLFKDPYDKITIVTYIQTV